MLLLSVVYTVMASLFIEKMQPDSGHQFVHASQVMINNIHTISPSSFQFSLSTIFKCRVLHLILSPLVSNNVLCTPVHLISNNWRSCLSWRRLILFVHSRIIIVFLELKAFHGKTNIGGSCFHAGIIYVILGLFLECLEWLWVCCLPASRADGGLDLSWREAC